MGLAHSPRIVTNGLVLCLDAGNTKSYPGSGTTWTDLSGNGSVGTLTGGPTYSSGNGGSIVFDGVDDYVACTGSTTFTAATFIAWLYRNGAQSSYTGILHSRSSTNGGLNFYSSTSNLNYHWSSSPNNPPGWDSGLSIPDLAWSMCAVSAQSSSAIAYVISSSGMSTASNAFSHPSLTLDAFKVGVDFGFARYFKGNIPIAQVYNRALTTAEIQQNFNALRGRFGI